MRRACLLISSALLVGCAAIDQSVREAAFDRPIVCFSTESIERLSDDDLERGYRQAARWREAPVPISSAGPAAFLWEMVRRRSSRWEHLIAAELERDFQDWRAFFRENDLDPGLAVYDLTLLTALRRIQGKRDPLAIEVPDGVVLEAAWPHCPAVPCVLVNVDAKGKPFWVDEATRLSGYRVEGFLVGGMVPVPPVVPDLGTTTTDALSFYHTLQPDSPVPEAVRIDDQLTFPGPGEYLVRVCLLIPVSDDRPLAQQTVLAWSRPVILRLTER